ncbi:MAG: YtpI family protein [Bacilli bacterium]
MMIAVGTSIVAFIFYLFFKAKAHRTHYPALKAWTQQKARMCLGIFVASYGANVVASFDTTIGLIVGIIFIVVGVASFVAGVVLYRKWLHLASVEWDTLQSEK